MDGVGLLHLVDAQVEVGLRVGGGLEEGVGHAHAYGHVQETRDFEGEEVDVEGASLLKTDQGQGEPASCGEGLSNRGHTQALAIDLDGSQEPSPAGLLDARSGHHVHLVLHPIDGPDEPYLADPGADALALANGGGTFGAVVQVTAEKDVDVEAGVGEQAEGLVGQTTEVEVGALGAQKVRVVLHVGGRVAAATDAVKGNKPASGPGFFMEGNRQVEKKRKAG